jgi:5,10-methenyltetrahydrofolate synthetase
VIPDIVVSPVVGFDGGNFRLGYGGGFYDRTLAALQPRPYTVGLGYAAGFLPALQAEPHDVPLDAILNELGVVWPMPLDDED